MAGLVVQEIQSGGLTWKCLPDLELGFDTYLEEFKSHLLSFVRPKWHPENLQVKVFDGGISNKLVAIFDREKGLKNSREDVVLLRINGLGTGAFINRKDEIVTIIFLHRAGLVPPVYCQLKNGLCYGFMPGRALMVDDVREESMMKRIVRTMTKLHSLEIPAHFQGSPPVVWQKMDMFLKIIPETFGDEKKDKCFKDTFGSIDIVRRDIEEAKQKLSEFTSPIVFCHNDLLIGNLIFDEETDTVGMIDFEYGGPNYLAYDIANHFCEFAGIDNVDYGRYPDEVLQKKWLRMYLQEAAKLRGEEGSVTSIPDEEIHQLYRVVNKFALTSHLFWGVWALFQAANSTIDFNYIEYAGIRYEEFKRRKEQFYAL